jgi:hypothetical protein
MRTVLAVLGLWLAASVTNFATAEVVYPYCAYYSGILGSNCGFSTSRQCQSAISGNGGFCGSNPRYHEEPSPGLRRR